VVIGLDGSSSLSRESDEPPPNEQIAERLRKSQEGVEQTVTVLLKTWTSFMVNSMIAEADDKYHLALVDGKYRLTSSENGADLAVDFNSDFEMDRVSYKSAQLTGEFKPTFETNPNGFVLTGYSATFATPVAGGAMNIEVQFENQTIERLRASAHRPCKDSLQRIGAQNPHDVFRLSADQKTS